jgi:predicted PurR-regulated permease PerM
MEPVGSNGAEPALESGQLSPRRWRDTFFRRAFVVVGITIAIILLLLFVWFSFQVLLLVFAGILMAIFLHGLADWLSERTRLSRGWSLAVVLLGLLGLIALGVWRLAPEVAEQVDQLAEQIPQSLQQLRQYIERYGWGRQLLATAPGPDELMNSGGGLLARITGIFSSTIGAIGSFFVILFIGIYLAIEPQLY